MIAHVFVDAENIPPSVTFKVVEYFGKEHTITKVDIVAKEDTLPYKYRELDEKIYRVQNCFYGKNSADTWLCFEIVRAIIDEPDLELIIIVSSDKDFLPAIKFAVDYEKKVFIVSNGEGHKTLIEQMKILNIDSAQVELRDYRLKFSATIQKLEKFLPRLSFHTKKFFFDRESRIKFILVKKGDKFFEVPFVKGMSVTIFGRILHELNILSKKNPTKNFINENFLKILDDRVYFKSESEIAAPTPAEQIENYFSEHAAETVKIFIKHNEKIFEIPFVKGMPLELFGKFLRERNIIGKNASVKNIARKNCLEVRDGKVYLCDEERLSELYAESSGDLDAYFSEHAAETIEIFIKHNEKIFEVPFVNGMLLTLFDKLLRDENIIGKNSSATETIAQSLLEIRDERVFLLTEEEMAEICVKSYDNVEDYFGEYISDIREITIRSGEKIFEIPFVNGMPLKIFNKILVEQKVIAGFDSPIILAEKNSLIVQDDKVFINEEAVK